MRAATRASAGRNTSPNTPATAVATRYAHAPSADRSGSSASATASATEDDSHTTTNRAKSPTRKPVRCSTPAGPDTPATRAPNFLSVKKARHESPIRTGPARVRLGSDHAPADPSAAEALENDTTQGRPGVRTS